MTNIYLPTESADDATYGVNGLNQITSETLDDGTVWSLAYDKNGNLTNDSMKDFAYDLFNRLTSVTGGASFEYDASGRLYSIITPTTNTYFLYDGTALIGEYKVDGNGNVNLQRRYVHGLDVDTPIVWYEGSTVSDTTRSYLVSDELGSIVLITDNNGVAIHHNAYDEYGVPNTGNLGRFQYTGQAWLSEAEVYYYKARVYNPYLGRFHQTDPIGYGDGMNMYAYVGNDPTNNRDPSGRFCIPCLGAAIGATAYVVSKLVAGEDPTLAGLAASAAAGAVGGFAIGAASSAGIATITAGTTFAETGFGVAAGLVTETAVIATVSGASAVAGNTALNIVESYEATGEAPTHPLAGAETSFAIGAVLGPSGGELATATGRVVGRGVASVSPASARAAGQLTELAVEAATASGGEVLYNKVKICHTPTGQDGC